jgi:hypothetical protein
MNKLTKCGTVKEYGMTSKFQTYEPQWGAVQIRDNRPDKHRKPERHGCVVVLPVLGGQYATYQTTSEAKRLARRIVRFLNA